ncbi:MAG TPA: hypothetical protein VMU48_22075 [Terracidiphilus sp.]|nr:hypothetical protein [Terracidiphilus sp.]
MKKIVFASVMALVSLSLVIAPMLRAQEAGQVSLPPDQFNAYQMAITQSDPTAKAEALEGFLKTYPQSQVKASVLDMLMDTYQSLHDADKTLNAASRLLQVDPNNMKALYISTFIKKTQCAKTIDPRTGKSNDAQTCDDAAALATKGLAVPKPAGVSDDDWKKQTDATYPVFHSTIALDDDVVKADYKGAIAEYDDALNLMSPDQSKSAGLVDMLQLADVYTKPAVLDLPKAVWFYARVWDFAPPAYKAQIEPKLEYYYKKYHGGLDGLDQIKTAAQATTFPPGTFTIAKAKSPAEQIHDLLASTPDLNSLALQDKETVLALGSKDDADKLWSLLQGKQTPVPGTVIASMVTVVKLVVTEGVKPTDYTVNLKAPVACKDVPAEDADTKAKEDFITNNGSPDDITKLTTLFSDSAAHIRRLVLDPQATQIKMAVTQDAKSSNVPDFIVNLKDPTPCKDIPAAGQDFGLQPAAELDGTYDTYRQIPPASANAAQTAEIVLNGGFVQPAAKKRPVAPHRPAAGHRPAR